jgi:hypothetical protein
VQEAMVVAEIHQQIIALMVELVLMDLLQYLIQ